MPSNAESWYGNYFALPVAPWATEITLGTPPTTTSGRVYAKNDSQEERIDYTGVSGSTITGCTRQMSATADPSTSWGSWYTWIAWTEVILVWMHDQLPMKTKSNTYTAGTVQTYPDIDFNGTTTGGLKVKSLTTVQRDAIASPANGHMIYNSTTGEFNVYQGGAWSAVASWSTQPNASTTVAGKVEAPTDTEVLAGDTTWGTGALLTLLGSQAKSLILDKSLRLPMVAGENLTAWDLVYADPDGSARKTIKKATTPAQLSTVTWIDVTTNSTHQIRCEYLTTDKAIIIYVKAADNIAYWRVVTFARGTITVGSEQAITTAMNTSTWPDLAVLSSWLFVVTHCKNADTKAYGTACTVSWTTITAGTEVKMYDTDTLNANTSPFIAKLSATSFCIWLHAATSDDPIAVAGTISWTTITAWTAVAIKATTMNTDGFVLMTYVSDGVIATAYDNGTNRFVNMLTVSWTTITAQTEVDTGIAWYCSGSDQILYLWAWSFALVIGNVASITRFITYNVANQTARTVPVMMNNYYITNDYTVLFNYWYALSLGNNKIAYVNQSVGASDIRFRIFQINTNGIMMPTFDTTLAGTVGEVCCAKLTTNQDKVLLIYQDTGTTNLNYSLYWNTEEQFIGSVATTTTAAWTVPINNSWTTAISWLTAWQPYYVWDAGAVATSGTKQIGVALTTTSLLLS